MGLLYFLFLALLLVMRPHPVSAIQGDAACGRFMCVNATVGEEMINYEITTVFSQPPGWISLGFGYHMKSSHMVIMWENRDGTHTLSQRYALGHREPIILHHPPRVATLTKPKTYSWQPHNSKSFAFQIPKNYSHRGLNPTDPHIWAYSVRQPISSSPDIYTLGQHYAAGSLKLDLSREAPTGDPPGMQNIGIPYDPPTDDISSDIASPASVVDNTLTQAHAHQKHEKYIIAHGSLLSLGFLVFVPTGSLVARWARTMTPAWFPIHRVLNYYLAFPVILLGWILGPIAVISGDSSHLSDPHKICGVVMIFLYFFQANVGKYIHRRKKANPERPAHPPANILHVVLGIVLLASAFLQVGSGLNEWNLATGFPTPEWITKLYGAWLIVVPTAYALGLILLRRQLYQERNGLRPKFAFESFSDYIILPNGATANENVKYPNDRGGSFVNGSNDNLQETREQDLSTPLLYTR